MLQSRFVGDGFVAYKIQPPPSASAALLQKRSEIQQANLRLFELHRQVHDTDNNDGGEGEVGFGFDDNGLNTNRKAVNDLFTPLDAIPAIVNVFGFEIFHLFSIL